MAIIDSKSLAQKVWQDPIYFLAFGFGSGLMPIAPGTWGTIAAIPIFLILAKLSSFSYSLITLSLFWVGSWICQKVSDDLKIHDFNGIVIDEIVGFLITMFLIPVTIVTILTGFLLFRIFDIWKPFPIRYLDGQIKSGFGIMLDDVLAAVYSWIILKLLFG